MSARLSRHAGTDELRTSSNKRCKCRATHKMKDPSGGTTGRVKPYGRLGWMGARAEYSRWGGCFRFPHMIGRRWPPHVQTVGKFFNLLEMSFRDENLLRGRTIGFDDGRFIRRHGCARRAQIASCRNI